MSTGKTDQQPGARWRPVFARDEKPALSPPRELLNQATAVLGRDHGVSQPSIRWSWGKPRLRPHSHVLPIVAHLPGNRRIDAWYKVVFVPQSPDGGPNGAWLARIRQGLRVAQRATASISRLGTDCLTPEQAVLLPLILAADEELLRVLVTSVPGKPLGRVLSPRPAQIFALDQVFHRVGRAIRVVEELANERPSLLSTGTRERAMGTLERALDSLALPPDALRAIESRFQWLLRETERNGAATYVHGDLSGSNILVRAGGGIGLIDLDWRPRPRGFDLATYSVRLQLEKPRIEPLTRRCIKNMIAGYGDEIVRAPHFHLERSQRWLRLLWQGTVPTRSRTGMRVIEELCGGSAWLPVG